MKIHKNNLIDEEQIIRNYISKHKHYPNYVNLKNNKEKIVQVHKGQYNDPYS